MLCVILLGLLCASALAEYQPQYYSYSPAVGSGSGSTYTVSGDGRITALRVWENYNYVRGFQFQYDYIWSPIGGFRNGDPLEIQLFEDETIIEISGKYSHYVNWVVFTTSRGRTLTAGQPSGSSFNFFPRHEKSELVMISGKVHGYITAIAAHWATVHPAKNSTASGSESEHY